MNLTLCDYDAYLKIKFNNGYLVFPLYFEESSKFKKLKLEELLNEISLYKDLHDKVNDAFHPNTWPTIESLNTVLANLIDKIEITPSLVRQISIRTVNVREERLKVKSKIKEKYLYPGINETEKIFMLITTIYLIKLQIVSIYDSSKIVKKCG